MKRASKRLFAKKTLSPQKMSRLRPAEQKERGFELAETVQPALRLQQAATDGTNPLSGIEVREDDGMNMADPVLDLASKASEPSPDRLTMSMLRSSTVKEASDIGGLDSESDRQRHFYTAAVKTMA